MPRKRLSSVEYSTSPSAAANVTRFARAKPDPVGAEVCDQHAVAVFYPTVAANGDRLDELVGFAAAIGGCDGLHRVLGAIAGCPHDHPISLFDTIPPLIAIHRIIATAQGSDPETLEAGDVLTEFLQI